MKQPNKKLLFTSCAEPSKQARERSMRGEGADGRVQTKGTPLDEKAKQ